MSNEEEQMCLVRVNVIPGTMGLYQSIRMTWNWYPRRTEGRQRAHEAWQHGEINNPSTTIKTSLPVASRDATSTHIQKFELHDQ